MGKAEVVWRSDIAFSKRGEGNLAHLVFFIDGLEWSRSGDGRARWRHFGGPESALEAAQGEKGLVRDKGWRAKCMMACVAWHCERWRRACEACFLPPLTTASSSYPFFPPPPLPSTLLPFSFHPPLRFLRLPHSAGMCVRGVGKNVHVDEYTLLGMVSVMW